MQDRLPRGSGTLSSSHSVHACHKDLHGQSLLGINDFGTAALNLFQQISGKDSFSWYLQLDVLCLRNIIANHFVRRNYETHMHERAHNTYVHIRIFFFVQVVFKRSGVTGPSNSYCSYTNPFFNKLVNSCT